SSGALSRLVASIRITPTNPQSARFPLRRDVRVFPFAGKKGNEPPFNQSATPLHAGRPCTARRAVGHVRLRCGPGPVVRQPGAGPGYRRRHDPRPDPARRTDSRERLLRRLVGVAFMVMATLHIYLGPGVVEILFGIFMLLAFLLTIRY